jgi:hypothetical protein
VNLQEKKPLLLDWSGELQTQLGQADLADTSMRSQDHSPAIGIIQFVMLAFVERIDRSREDWTMNDQQFRNPDTA